MSKPKRKAAAAAPPDALDTTVFEVLRRLAESGSHMAIDFRLTIKTGVGLPFSIIGYPVPAGFRLETQRLPALPKDWFEAIVRNAGFEPHPDDETRWVRVVEIPPV